jgi:hypothetical protein
VHQILFSAKIALGRLDRSVTQQPSHLRLTVSPERCGLRSSPELPAIRTLRMPSRPRILTVRMGDDTGVGPLFLQTCGPIQHHGRVRDTLRPCRLRQWARVFRRGRDGHLQSRPMGNILLCPTAAKCLSGSHAECADSPKACITGYTESETAGCEPDVWFSELPRRYSRPLIRVMGSLAWLPEPVQQHGA